jgi:hypothetical protein
MSCIIKVVAAIKVLWTARLNVVQSDAARNGCMCRNWAEVKDSEPDIMFVAYFLWLG